MGSSDREIQSNRRVEPHIARPIALIALVVVGGFVLFASQSWDELTRLAGVVYLVCVPSLFIAAALWWAWPHLRSRFHSDRFEQRARQAENRDWWDSWIADRRSEEKK